MIDLNLKLSSFRVSVSNSTQLPASCQLRFSCSTRRLRAVESPLISKAVTQYDSSPSTEIVFPASFSVSWSETLPDRLALRAAVLRIDAIRQPKSRLSAALLCGYRPALAPLGILRLDLFSLLKGTVCYALRLRLSDNSLTPYTLSFNAVVEQLARVTLTFSDLSLHLPHHRQHNLCSAFLTVEHPSTNRLSTSSTERFVPSNSDPSDDVCNTQALTASWSHDISLNLRSQSLFHLAHSYIRVRIHDADNRVEDANSDDTNIIIEASVPLQHVWGALLYPGTPFRHSISACDGTLTFAAMADVAPPDGQLVNGVTTNDTIIGASTVIFGSDLPDKFQFPSDPELPEPWRRLIDSFGMRYFCHPAARVNVWTTPLGETPGNACEADAVAAERHGFKPVKRSLYQDVRTGCHVWVHPDVVSVAISALDASLADAATPEQELDFEGPPSGHTSFSLSTLDACELNPASFSRLHDIPCEESDYTSTPRPRIVEMKWTMLGREFSMPGDGMEGHTLTAVNNRRAAIRFGGATGIRCTRTNILQRLDPATMHWNSIRPQGVPPDPRTGHGAVALGTDASRLLIFGGTSSRGARNDMHVFHTESETWSPVMCTGTPPAPRARLGMTVTSDRTVALVFGGRSLYRWLGGKYYDPLYVHAFHAERVQWVQLRPRSSAVRPAPRSGSAVQFLNGRHMVVHGGYDEGDKFFDDTCVFDLVSSSWVTLPYPDEPTRPTAREGHASTVMDQNVMLVCGGDGTASKMGDVHMFDGSSFRWLDRPSTVGYGPARIVDAAMTTLANGVNGNEMAILCGGDDGFQYSRNVYSLQVSHRSALNADVLTEIARTRAPNTCVVCLDASVEAVFLWCSHSVCCRSCARLINRNGDRRCPLCRKPISRIMYN